VPTLGLEALAFLLVRGGGGGTLGRDVFQPGPGKPSIPFPEGGMEKRGVRGRARKDGEGGGLRGGNPKPPPPKKSDAGPEKDFPAVRGVRWVGGTPFRHWWGETHSANGGDPCVESIFVGKGGGPGRRTA